jgi:hypothetical protein
MNGILCTLSEARLEQLLLDPELLPELLAARRETEIPGLLDIGKAWDALDVILSDRGRQDPLLGDALLGRSGRELPTGNARLLDPGRVRELAAALAQLPDQLVRDRYSSLFGRDVHGEFGQETCEPNELKFIREKVGEIQDREIAALQATLDQIAELYEKAAGAGHAMMLVVV